MYICKVYFNILRKHARAIYKGSFSEAKIENFRGKIDCLNILTQNIHCGYMLEPLQSPVKRRVYGGGVYITRTCFPDVFLVLQDSAATPLCYRNQHYGLCITFPTTTDTRHEVVG